jgi:P2 family phage major capsid protein
MKNETRKLFNGFLSDLAQLNGIDSSKEQFTVSPSVQQKIESRMQESSDFLGKINIMGVDEIKGEKIGLGVGSPIASRVNTAANGSLGRQTKSPVSLIGRGYECFKTNYDTHIPYAMLDAWAKFPDFQVRIRNAILQRQALDRIVVGFNGASAADDTNLVAHPMLQDVNKGWLQMVRELASERVLDGSDAVIGSSAPYKHLDALVYDAAASLLDPWHRDRTDLVAIVSRDLLHDKHFPLINGFNQPTERNALDMIMSQRRIGGLQALAVPYFPAGTVLITPLSNLSIYYQNSGRRRTVVDNAKFDRIENYESSNDAYVVEDLGACCLIEGITDSSSPAEAQAESLLGGI